MSCGEIDFYAVRHCRFTALQRIEQGLDPQPDPDNYDPCYDPDVPVGQIEADLGIDFEGYLRGDCDEECVYDYTDDEEDEGGDD
ncbi:MAG: hypothetical protein KKA32_01320 [Actinobacteria bacterium]|nr:hypothetical protein [Actinomycetota bacterium]